MILDSAAFIHPVKLPTHQSELRGISQYRDSERNYQEPDKDEPGWLIVLKDRWIEVSRSDAAKARLGGNAEKDRIVCIPLENVASFVAIGPAPKKTKALAASA